MDRIPTYMSTFTFYDPENSSTNTVIGYFHIQYDKIRRVYCAYLIKNNKVKIIANSYRDIPGKLKKYFLMAIPFQEMNKAIWNCFNNVIIDKIYEQHSFDRYIVEVFGKIYPINQYPEKKDIDMDAITDAIEKINRKN
jgi:hypothetical protein